MVIYVRVRVRFTVTVTVRVRVTVRVTVRVRVRLVIWVIYNIIYSATDTVSVTDTEPRCPAYEHILRGRGGVCYKGYKGHKGCEHRNIGNGCEHILGIRSSNICNGCDGSSNNTQIRNLTAPSPES